MLYKFFIMNFKFKNISEFIKKKIKNSLIINLNKIMFISKKIKQRNYDYYWVIY